jgi:hypothetical protein
MKTVYWTISIVITIHIILEIVQRRELDYSYLVAIAVNFWGYQICKSLNEKAIVKLSIKDDSEEEIS